EIDKVAFAHVAVCGDAARDALGVAFGEARADFRDGAGGAERGAWERIDAFFLERGELLPARDDEIAFFFHGQNQCAVSEVIENGTGELRENSRSAPSVNESTTCLAGEPAAPREAGTT